ncbi:hypothetical protein [Leucobacter sp. L43]|uniref:hypothetical protein n=1 Tax=Leucobacter sp. L43 TaxID=2798040 RepID=UPI0019078413|nr:hypothetical protein [Leucobacter sp. L43]
MNTATHVGAAVANSQGEGQIAPIVLGLGAVIAGLIGSFWIGMAGLVWRPWEFGTTYHWEVSESPLGVTIGLFFFAIAAGLLLWLVARGIWTWRKRSTASRVLVVVVPIIAIALIFAGSAALLSPGGSQPTWGL